MRCAVGLWSCSWQCASPRPGCRGDHSPSTLGSWRRISAQLRAFWQPWLTADAVLPTQTCANPRQRQAPLSWSVHPSGHAASPSAQSIQLWPWLADVLLADGLWVTSWRPNVAPLPDSVILPGLEDAPVPCLAEVPAAPPAVVGHCALRPLPPGRSGWNWLVDSEVIRNRHPQTM